VTTLVAGREVGDRRTRRRAATRQEILDAAWTLARQRGLTGWSLREVAEAVGMRAPSLYVYFVSKDAIYDAMFAQGYQQLLEQASAQPVTGEPRTVLRATARGFFDFCVADPARFQLLFQRVIPGFAPSAESYRVATDVLGWVRDMLAELGITDDGAVDLWTALTTGLASQQISNDPGGDRWGRLIDPAVDMFLAAMPARR
jgi:AcrR family transcriptional regulator